MTINSLPTERVAIAAVLDPEARTAGDTTSAYVAASHFNTMLGVLMAGAIPAGANVVLKFVQAKDATGTDVKDITGKVTTALTGAGDSDKQAAINVRAEELDVNNGFGFVALVLTVAGTGSPLTSAQLLGMDPRFGPASDDNASSVKEIIGL